MKYAVLIQYRGNYIEVIEFNCMFEIDTSRNSSQNILGALKVDFFRFGGPNDPHRRPAG